ncbi:UMP kinase [Candidatus Bathyarchaeota archaeon]|nr:UMP kinase [Candidatus Bathyarchaeota archaeon]
MKVVVRVGGSVVGSPLNSLLIAKYVDLLKELKQQGHEVVAVVGGGSLAREFIKAAADLGLEETRRDWAAIHVSRLFAQLFMLSLGEIGCGSVPVSVDEAQACLDTGKVVVFGGLRPGMTTDSVAALIGERIQADLLVKGSNVDGIYSKDPKKYSGAKKLDALRFEDLGKLFEADSHRAGINQIIDPEAVKILQRCKIKTVVVNGYDSENVLAAVKGKQVGTVIT